jgi:hypothetical protein
MMAHIRQEYRQRGFKVRWHYTNRAGWDAVKRAKRIALSTNAIAEGERPAAWFSSNPDWEYVSAANIVVTLEIHGKIGHLKLNRNQLVNGVPKWLVEPQELFRITVEDEVAPLPWEEYKKIANTPADALVQMEQHAYARPNEWFASLEEVESEAWLAVERWNREHGAWEPTEENWG